MRIHALLLMISIIGFSRHSVSQSTCIEMLRRLTVSGCKIDYCYTNAILLLQRLKDLPDFDPAQANVLYITNKRGYKVHVVVEYKGIILDFLHIPAGWKYGGKHYIEDTSQVVPLAAQKYFDSPDMDRSKVLIVPGLQYQAEFPSLRHTHYLKQLDDGNGLSITDYLKAINEKSNTP